MGKGLENLRKNLLVKEGYRRKVQSLKEMGNSRVDQGVCNSNFIYSLDSDQRGVINFYGSLKGD